MDKIYLGVQKYKKMLYYNVFKETFCYSIVFFRTYKRHFPHIMRKMPVWFRRAWGAVRSSKEA